MAADFRLMPKLDSAPPPPAGISLPPVLAPANSNGDLNGSIENSIAQASTMWRLHCELDAAQSGGESLAQQIVDFSAVVFDAIQTNYPALRNAGSKRLWFIYFKGLLTANTHPPEVMILALRYVDSKWGIGGTPPPPREPNEMVSSSRRRISDDEALEQIAHSLEQGKSSS
jgi:hypothetical protein